MEARPDFKSMSTAKKLGYVWDYYRFHIMGVIVLIITFGSIIHHYATLKEPVLELVFLNAAVVDDNVTPFEEFMDLQEFDPASQEILVATSLSFPLHEGAYTQDVILFRLLLLCLLPAA